MQSYIPIVVGVLIGMVALGVPAFLFARYLTREFQKLTGAYERIIDKADDRYESVMDRLHATKNLPPARVDMQAIYEERREEDRERKLERRNGGPVPSRSIGDVDRVQREMEQDILRRTSGATLK